jgi:hypothetical protein
MEDPTQLSEMVASVIVTAAAHVLLSEFTETSEAAVTVGALLSDTTTLAVTKEEQPFASVTVYVEAPTPAVKEPVPVYGVTPPEAVTVTVVVEDAQGTSEWDSAATSAVGWVMVTDAVVEQEASLTVTV